MKGNEKIGITAEAVALMKAQVGDRFSKYFVTPRIVKLNSVVGRVFSRDLLSNVFSKRLSLAKDMHRAIKDFKPEQLVDLGAGVDTFGLEYALANPHYPVIEVDFPKMMDYKQRMLAMIKKQEGLGSVPNLHLVSADVVMDNLMQRLKHDLKRGKRTLVYSVGLNTYLNSGQYKSLLHNVNEILVQLGNNSAYLSHEPIKAQHENMTPGVSGKLLRSLVGILTGNRSFVHFNHESDLKSYFQKHGFGSVEILKRRKDNLIYLARV